MLIKGQKDWILKEKKGKNKTRKEVIGKTNSTKKKGKDELPPGTTPDTHSSSCEYLPAGFVKQGVRGC